MKFPDLVHAVKAEPTQQYPLIFYGAQQLLGFHILDSRVDTHAHLALFGSRHASQLQDGGGIRRQHLQMGEQRRSGGLHQVPLEAEVRGAQLRPPERHHASPARIRTISHVTCGRPLSEASIPSTSLYVQMMNISEEMNQTFDPLDDTKTWPEDKFPLMPVGKMILNRNPENFFSSGGTGGILSGQPGSGHRVLRRQDAAGQDLLLRRHPALPPGGQLQRSAHE